MDGSGAWDRARVAPAFIESGPYWSGPVQSERLLLSSAAVVQLTFTGGEEWKSQELTGEVSWPLPPNRECGPHLTNPPMFIQQLPKSPGLRTGLAAFP